MKIPSELLQQCLFLAGPTACGKTETGLLLAERLGGEILSLDSMSIYRGLDVGTAKPTPDERRRAPHHLLDLADPWEDFSVAQYIAAADRAVREVLDRGKVPIFVGGTGLYLRSLLRGIFEGPPADESLRQQLEARYHAVGAELFYRELTEVDPISAARLHPRDLRRLVRAREVFELTGAPLSSFQQEPPLDPEQRPRHVIWLHPPRDWLYARINARVDQMLEQGLVEEVRALTRLPQPLGKTARQAIGYKEILDAWDAEESLDDAIVLIKNRSRQLARRQHTWFRNLPECTPLELDGSESPARIAETIAARWKV